MFPAIESKGSARATDFSTDQGAITTRYTAYKAEGKTIGERGSSLPLGECRVVPVAVQDIHVEGKNGSSGYVLPLVHCILVDNAGQPINGTPENSYHTVIIPGNQIADGKLPLNTIVTMLTSKNEKLGGNVSQISTGATNAASPEIPVQITLAADVAAYNALPAEKKAKVPAFLAANLAPAQAIAAAAA